MSERIDEPVRIRGILLGGIIGALLGGFVGALMGEGAAIGLSDGLTGFHFGGVGGAVLGGGLGYLLGMRVGPKGHARHHGEPKHMPPQPKH